MTAKGSSKGSCRCTKGEDSKQKRIYSIVEPYHIAYSVKIQRSSIVHSTFVSDASHRSFKLTIHPAKLPTHRLRYRHQVDTDVPNAVDDKTKNGGSGTHHSSTDSTRTKTSSRKPSRKPPTSPSRLTPSSMLTGARPSHSSISLMTRAARDTRRRICSCTDW